MARDVLSHTTPHPYWRPLRYEWSEPSLIGSLIMMSPLRILMLYRQEGLVHTHALYSMEAPWLPKSESGTRSPSLHLRHRGKGWKTGPRYALVPRHYAPIQMYTIVLVVPTGHLNHSECFLFPTFRITGVTTPVKR